MLMVSLTINLPEEAFSALRVDPQQFAVELRFAAAVQWYHQGLISGSKAAEIAGITRLAFLDELARRRLDTLKIDLGDLAAELGGS
jgi:predicted HTH domain antitoxin